MSLVSYAETQLSFSDLSGTEYENVLLNAIRVLSDQGHSNTSVHYLLGMVRIASVHENPYAFAMEDFTQRGWIKNTAPETDAPVDDDNIQELISQNILEVLELLTTATIQHNLDKDTLYSTFMRLAAFEPILQIVDEPKMWNQYADGEFQHKFMASLFKQSAKGRPYLDGVVFRTENDVCWTSRDSFKYIDLPCYSDDVKRHYITVDDDDRCVDEAEYQKYLDLVPDIVHPNTEKRKPKSML